MTVPHRRFAVGEPYAAGTLDVGDGQRLAWRRHGRPGAPPVVCLHGGPGSGCGPSWASWFDPERYDVVLYDQRGCGESTPDAADAGWDPTVVTTTHHLSDLERLRTHLGYERWGLFGASWGSTLGLAYAQAHPDRVSGIVLFSVVTTTRAEVQWVTRAMRRIHPDAWERFAAPIAVEDRGDLAAAYHRLVMDPDPAVHDEAARQWCRWEDTHVDLTGEATADHRYSDPRFRLRFARQVTWAWANAGFLPDGALLDGAERLHGIPGALITGRSDVSGPADIAYDLASRWPDARLTIVSGAGHGTGMAPVVLAEIERVLGTKSSSSPCA